MLASMLLESAGGFIPDVSPNMLSKYTHEDGAALIAMESAADLHDIFMEGFYGMEELEFQQTRATMEGTSEDVMEGIVDKIKSKASSVLKTIKEKLKAMWEKVKAFFHNVKRYLSAMFGNTLEFVKKYEGELKKLKLAGMTYVGYEYSIDVEKKKDLKALVQSTDEGLQKTTQQIKDIKAGAEDVKVMKTMYDELYKEYLEDLGTTDPDKLSETIWSTLRSGAKSEADKKTLSVDMNYIIRTLKDSQKRMAIYNEYGTAIDKVYSNAIKVVNDAEKAADENKLKHNAAVCRLFATYLSRLQAGANLAVNQTKSAMVERDKVYKGVILKALRYKAK